MHNFKIKNGNVLINKSSLISKVSFEISEPSLLLLAGLNGSGKTTFIQHIQNSFYQKDTCYWNEQDLFFMNKIDRAKIFSFVQFISITASPVTVYDIIKQGRYPHIGLLAKLSDKDNGIIGKVVETFELGPFLQRSFKSLSDGEKQKVLIAKALVQDTPIIIFDEPMNFLDFPAKKRLLELFVQIVRDEKKTILFSSHDFPLVFDYVEKILVIDDKKLIETSPENFPCSAIFHRIFK